MIIAIWRNLWRLFVDKRSSSFLHVFLEILQIFLSTQTHSNTINLYKTFVFISWQKIIFAPPPLPFPPTRMLFWRYCKDIRTSYFGYFGHAWLHTPKMIVSTCRRFRCLSACQKYTSSFTSFLRYYILKNPAIWLVDSILAHYSKTRTLPDMGLVVKYQEQY